MRLEVPQRATIAYLVLSYDRLEQVQRLVSRLYDPVHSLVLLHVDTKVATEALLAKLRSWALRLWDGGRRVQIFSEFRVHRGGRSMVEVQLRAMEILLADPSWDYYINLSDTHYPAEAAAWVGAYLWLHRGANYARITSTKYYDPTLQGGRGATYDGPRRDDLYVACDRSLAFECEGRLFSLAPGAKYPPVLSGVTAASGPEWVVLSRGFVEYVHRGLLPDAAPGLVRAVYDDLTALSIPEETFFQTVLLSSPFCESLVRHDFLYLDLYDAPWLTSPDSDFPFQSPHALNASHLFKISKDEPWFIRKVDASRPSAVALITSLDAAVGARARHGTVAGPSASWSGAEAPRGLCAALEECRAGSARARRWSRPGWLQATHCTPWVLEVHLRSPCPTSRPSAPPSCWVAGWLRLTERLAVPRRRSQGIPVDGPQWPVVALRVGCDWAEAAHEFRGEVSVVPSTSCGALALVAYVTNTGFEGSVSIHWSHGSRLTRRSGGHVPRGFAMFVDRLESPQEGLAPGRWTVAVADAEGGRVLGRREFLVYSEANVDHKFTGLLAAYSEFFELSAGD